VTRSRLQSHGFHGHNKTNMKAIWEYIVALNLLLDATATEWVERVPPGRHYKPNDPVEVVVNTVGYELHGHGPDQKCGRRRSLPVHESLTP
jgi:hypothetical protein